MRGVVASGGTIAARFSRREYVLTAQSQPIARIRLAASESPSVTRERIAEDTCDCLPQPVEKRNAGKVAERAFPVVHIASSGAGTGSFDRHLTQQATRTSPHVFP